MPIDYSEYPSNWLTKIRPAILKRANHRCEWCGKPDRSEHYTNSGIEDTVMVASGGKWYDRIARIWRDAEGKETPQPEGKIRSIRVVLTIAHLDHDKMNNDPDNLRSLCQSCHLSYDMPRHVANRRRNRDRARGQLTLFN